MLPFIVILLSKLPTVDIHQLVFSLQIKYLCNFHEQVKSFYGCIQAVSSISPAAFKAEHFVAIFCGFFSILSQIVNVHILSLKCFVTII